MKNIVFILLAITSFSYAQVGIGTTTPSSAAVLHLETANYTTTKVGGFIMPVVTEAEQSAIPVDVSTTRDDGLMVFVSDPGTGKWCWDIYDAEQLVWRSIKCNTPVVVDPPVCDTVIYTEDFSTYANNSGVNEGVEDGDYPGSVTWNVEYALANMVANDWAMVNNEVFELRDTGGPVTLTLAPIDISAYTTICFSVDVAGRGDLEYDTSLHGTDDTNNQNDYVNIEYSIDGGAWVRILDFGGNGTSDHTLVAPSSANGTFPDSTVSESGLSGGTLQIRIKGQTWADDEYLTYDNIIIEGGN